MNIKNLILRLKIQYNQMIYLLINCKVNLNKFYNKIINNYLAINLKFLKIKRKNSQICSQIYRMKMIKFLKIKKNNSQICS